VLSDRQAREQEIRDERAVLVGRIHAANGDLIARAERDGVTVTLDDPDTLRIVIGQMPDLFYTQRSGGVSVHLDSATDAVIGFTIPNITSYARDHTSATGGFSDLLPALHRRGTIQLPARTEAAVSIGRDLQELVPA
jgi:hypothetical protein